ncbi:MAG TPA: acyl-CoA dehydrogenase family protein [Caulobacteraceae bacterium]|jgi:acyl-CoA dehydrogenase
MSVHYIGLAAEHAVAPDLKSRAKAVAEVARAHAAEVDAAARFPAEAIEAAKAHGLLGAMVPQALGGEGASVTAMAEVCYALGQACSSTAMIFAMHQVKVACLVRHAGADRWVNGFLARVAEEQLLLASSTTEGQGGGDVRSSAAPIAWEGSRISLRREATVMSYGAQADAVVTTARRDADAAPTDQVLVVFPKESYSLEPTLTWETLGMRGTCSAGFRMIAEGEAGMVLSEPYASIHAQTMTPFAHLLWSSVWAGIAAGAVERARLFLRKAARNSEGKLPPASAHYLKALSSLHALRALVAGALARYEAASGDTGALAEMEFQTAITMLKVEVSELALQTVLAAMRTCGLGGYRNDGDASIGRHLRDILSAPIMINNDRILTNLGPSALMSATPDSLVA